MMDLNFFPFPEIITERMLLREINQNDVSEILFLRSDPHVMRYIDREPAKNTDDALTYIQTLGSMVKNGEALQWGITERPNNTLIGTICFFKFEKENFRAEVGYSLHPDYHRRGMMKEALNNVLEYGFNKLKLHSVTANVNPNNSASIALLQSVGFKQEAYFREDYYFNGKFLDSAIYCLVSPL